MRVVIVGAGKVGYYLAKTLMEHGHVPTLIDTDRTTCAFVADNLDVSVIWGDGTTTDVLKSAGTAQCDAFVSVTGQDEGNLISCQLAKQVFNVKKTIAKVNNPKNARVMRELGIDIAISSTENIASLIEHEVDTAKIKRLVAINQGEASICEAVLPPDYKLHGIRLSEIRLPSVAVIISISRGGKTIIPRGETQLLSGDKVLFLTKNDALYKVQQLLKIEKL